MVDLLVINTLNGIVYGLILFMVASGLTLSMGLMGYINLAHGALFAFGGGVGATVFFWSGSFPLAILASMVTAGLIGLVIERGFLRHIAGLFVPQILVTIGFLFILENIHIWIWRAQVFEPVTVPALAGTIALPFTGDLFPIYRIFVIFIVLAIAAGFFYFDRTRLGALIRAGMDDSQMVEGMGINISRIHVLVFAAAAAAAGLAAALALPVFGNSYQSAFEILLLSLIVTVVGGMGSVRGAFVFALVAGVLTTYGKVLIPETAMFLLYALMVVVLAFKPSGLFGR